MASAIIKYTPVYEGDTEPANPETGWIWIDTTHSSDPDPVTTASIYLGAWIPFAGG